MTNINLNVPGISCSHCEISIKKALNQFKGIKNINIDLNKKTVVFDYDESKAKLEEIKTAIEDQGYDIKN